MLTAIIVAAGDSRRMGFDKLFAAIAGKPVIAHTIRAFERTSSVDGIIVVAREDRDDEIKRMVHDENFKKVQSIIPGGKRRQDSVRAGLGDLKSVTRWSLRSTSITFSHKPRSTGLPLWLNQSTTH